MKVFLTDEQQTLLLDLLEIANVDDLLDTDDQEIIDTTFAEIARIKHQVELAV